MLSRIMCPETVGAGGQSTLKGGGTMLPKVEMVTKQQAQAQATCISHDQPACVEYNVEVPCPVAHYDSFFSGL